MKNLTFIPAICILLLFSHTASGWNMSWYNQSPWVGPNGVTPIAPGGMVQLIADGGDGEIIDPISTLGFVELIAWIEGGCPPLGDDFLVESSGPGAQGNPQYFQDFGDPAYNGYWGDFSGTHIINSSLPEGTQMYTRFFTSENPKAGDWYGTMGDVDGIGEFYTLEIDGAGFANYVYDVSVVGIADMPILPPEPGTILIGGVALILGFFKFRKKGQ